MNTSSAMEQTRYWMWARRKLINTRTPLFNSPITPSASYHESWEEQAFAEDSAGLLGGCVWPPRSYSCSFCRREFRSAQALGGHMNVHRRDRARLKQSSSSTDQEASDQQFPDQVSSLEYYSHNPKSNPNPNSGIIGSPSFSSANEHTLLSQPYPRSFTNQIPIRLPSALELKLELGSWKVREVESKGKRDLENDDEMMWSKKRRKIDELLPGVVKPSSSNLPEVLKLIPSPVEELDLELRLGDPPKIK